MKNNTERCRIVIPTEIADKIRAQAKDSGITWTATIISILKDHFVHKEIKEIINAGSH